MKVLAKMELRDEAAGVTYRYTVRGKNAWGEYEVKEQNLSPHAKKAEAYLTDDLDDALGTMAEMAKHSGFTEDEIAKGYGKKIEKPEPPRPAFKVEVAKPENRSRTFHWLKNLKVNWTDLSRALPVSTINQEVPKAVSSLYGKEIKIIAIRQIFLPKQGGWKTPEELGIISPLPIDLQASIAALALIGCETVSLLLSNGATPDYRMSELNQRAGENLNMRKLADFIEQRSKAAERIPESVKEVNAFFLAAGRGEYRLRRKGNHLWFDGPDTEGWASSSAPCCRPSHMNLGSWLDFLNQSIYRQDTLQ